jgi:phosphatidylserine decarboxylase
VEQNSELKTLLIEMLKEYEGGNVTLDTFYAVVDEGAKRDCVTPWGATNFITWYVLLPMSITPTGKKVLRHEAMQSWFKQLALTQKNYMDSLESAKVVPFLIRYWKQQGQWDDDTYSFVVPEGGYRTWNDYFTRDLKPGIRPIASTDPGSIVSPVDGNAISFYNIDPTKQLPAKGSWATASKILEGSKHATAFDQGSAVGIYLDEGNYHRYHSPARGRVVEVIGPRGIYFGTQGPGEFLEERNRAHVIIQTENHGLVAVVFFGMSLIQSVNVNVTEGQEIDYGDLIGNFAYGGSYAMVLTQKRLVPVPALGREYTASKSVGGTIPSSMQYRCVDSEHQYIMMGQSLGRIEP